MYSMLATLLIVLNVSTIACLDTQNTNILSLKILPNNLMVLIWYLSLLKQLKLQSPKQMMKMLKYSLLQLRSCCQRMVRLFFFSSLNLCRLFIIFMGYYQIFWTSALILTSFRMSSPSAIRFGIGSLLQYWSLKANGRSPSWMDLD